MDRLILVVYINIAGLHGDNMRQFVERVSNQIKGALDDDDIVWIFPRDGGENKVELLNKPIIVASDEYYEKLEEQLKRIEERLDDKIKDKETE